MTAPVILLMCGSLRAGSSNEAVLRTAQMVAPSPIEAVHYRGLAELPHFNPDDDAAALPAPVAALRAGISAATAILICSPEYAGTLPGSFKNLLDWTVGGTEICDKPVAFITAAAAGRGQGAEATLRTVLAYTGADIVESACVRIPVDRRTIGADGVLTDPGACEQLSAVMTELASRAPQSGPTGGPA